MRGLVWLVLSSALVAGAAALAGTEASPETLKLYDEGKRRYDAKDYAGALEKFDACATREPENARWPYNRGLALKKLGRTQQAIAALLEARRLDAGYKQKEIDQKLSELGWNEGSTRSPTAAPLQGFGPGPGDPTSSPSTTPANPLPNHPDPAESTRYLMRPPEEAQPENVVGQVGAIFCVVITFIVAVFAFIIVQVRKSGASQQQARARVADLQRAQAVVQALGPQLDRQAQRLTRLEHAMSLGEDPDARAHVDRAATNLKLTRTELGRVASGAASPEGAEGALGRARESLDAAEARLTGLYGAAIDGARGERVGCFFCARPLPTPESRTAVALALEGKPTHVLVCSTCARQVAAGQAPKVVTVNGRHWSEVERFDPYVHAHVPMPNAVEQPAWKLSNLGTLAAVAGGVAAAGLATAAVRSLLDLDGLKASSMSSLAAQAAAASAREKRRSRDTSTRDWRDNS